MNIGTAIKNIRIENGISQLQLAARSKISQTAISQIESGSRKPQEATIEAIAGALGVSVAQIHVLAINEGDIACNKPKRNQAVKQLATGKELIIKALK